MAEANIVISVKVSGLGSDTELVTRFTHTVTPKEVYKGYAVIGSTVCDLDLGTIDAEEVSGVKIVAKGTEDTDKVGILVNVDTGEEPATDDGNQVLNAGEACYINLHGGLDVGKVISLKGTAATTAIEYIVFGAHT